MIEKRQTTPSLEQRIAAALNGELKTSAAVADLIEETETASSVADHAVAEAKERTFDPRIIDDTAADKLRAAEICARRLHDSTAPLQEILAQRLAEDYAAKWEHNWEAKNAKVEAAAARFARYRELSEEMRDFLAEAEQIDAEVSELNGSAPPNEHRRLNGVEQTARGLKAFSASTPSILKNVQLPDWNDSKKMLWPKPRPSAASILALAMAPPAYDPKYSPEWWKAGHEKNRAEAERQKEEDAAAAIAREEFYKGH